MAVNIEDFDGILMSKLFPQAWPQMKLHVPVKEKAGDKTGPTSNSESSSPELFSLQEEEGVTNRYSLQSGYEAMTVATTDGQSEQSKPEQNLVPAGREGLDEMTTPESIYDELSCVEDKPASLKPEAGDGGSTLRRYLDGSLRDIDGRKYVHPKLR